MSASVSRRISRYGRVFKRSRGVQDHGKRSHRALIRVHEDRANGIQRMHSGSFKAPKFNTNTIVRDAID